VFGWGFHAHKIINKNAVFLLPNNSLFGFFKNNIEYLTENAVNPDKRRYILAEEAPRHYIDLDTYAFIGFKILPKYYSETIRVIPNDTLSKHGILPWHISEVQKNLTKALVSKDSKWILKTAADLGHYVADAHVPLHTTHNYDGQYTNQKGIHSLWETRLPELYSKEYDYLVGKAEYVEDVQKMAWWTINKSHNALDSVFKFEKEASLILGEELKYAFEEKNTTTVRTYSNEFSKIYADKLNGQVERQLRGSIKMLADLWYTSWIEAGQPDLSNLEKATKGDEESPAETIKNDRFLETHHDCNHFLHSDNSNLITKNTK
jgi:hypothetical protein